MSFVICHLSFAPAAVALSNPENKVAKIIENYVIAKYPNWATEDIRITFKYADKIFSSLRKIDSDVSFKILETYADLKPIGNVVFPIEIVAKGIERKIFVRAKVEVLKKVVVAANLIKRGRIVTDKDVKLEKRDVAMLPQKYFRDLNAVVSTETKTTIPKNSTLFAWMIKEIPNIHRGDKVAIRVVSPHLLLKTGGVALSDGYVGRKMTVKRKGSKKTLEGILISANEVEVKLK